jgi:hypothetical protein
MTNRDICGDATRLDLGGLLALVVACAALGCSSESKDEPGTGGSSGVGGAGTGGAGGSGTGGDSGAGTGGASGTGTGGASGTGTGGASGSGGTGGGIPDDAGDATTGEFLALTYNVAGLPEALSGSPNPLERMPIISQLLNDYDLVITQEDWQSPDPNPLAPTRVYHELLDDHVTHPYQSISAPIPLGNDPTRPSALLSDGLNEFSRVIFDPTAIEHVRWTECYGDATTGASDCLATKGFTRTVHTLANGVELDVYNLHGEAGRTDQDLPLMQQDFEVELADYINANSAGRAIILGGDTNLHTDRTPDGGIWQNFKQSTGIVDVCDTVDCGSDADDIDKFAYRSSSTLVIEPLSHDVESAKFTYSGGALSDHEPLAVRFRWTRQ